MKRQREHTFARLASSGRGWVAGFLCLAALNPHRAAAQQDQPTALQIAAALESAVVEAIERCEPSVVAIARVEAASAPDATPTNPSFVPSQYGTGVVFDRRGLILTSYQLVNKNDQYWVTTSDRKIYRAKPKGADPHSGLAVLQVSASDLKPIRFGDASNLRKGQFVVGLGNPYGIARDGQVSASWGIISNLARKAAPVWSDVRQNDKPSLHHFGTLIQTDAKLNTGTSGGPLVNLRGEMIGLSTALAATPGYELSAGYAIPIDDAFRRVIDVLKEGREVEYGLLGIVTEELDRKAFVEGRRGMRVRDVVPGTPAAKVGLQPGDVITHVNGERIYGSDGLMLEVGKQPVGATVRLQVQRDNRVLRLAATLAKKYVHGESIVTEPRESWRGVQIDHATAIKGYMERVRQNEVDLDGCVVVKDVRLDSPAWKQGLRPYDFVTHVGNVRVRNPEEFLAAVSGRSGPVRLITTDNERPVHNIPPGS